MLWNKWMRLILACLLCLGWAHNGLAQRNEEARLRKAIQVLEDLGDIPETSIPPALMEKAYGIAIIPGVIKIGLGLGGRWGKGILVVREDSVWSPPLFLSLGGGSVGWQFGVQSTDIVLIFRNRESIEAFLDGNFTLGVDASIAAGPVGRHVGAKTDVEFRSEIYSYSKSRGLFAGIALEGASLDIDDDANAAFYGKSLDPEDILEGAVDRIPDTVHQLHNAMKQTEETEDYGAGHPDAGT